jgi:hypothetical protein
MRAGIEHMRAFLATLLVVACLAVGAYLYLQRPTPTPEPPATAESAPGQLPASAADTPAGSATADRPASTNELDVEAREYVREITELKAQPLAADSADNFVQRDQTIQLLPTQKADTTTPEKLLADPSLKPETPITIIKDVDQIEIVTIERLRELYGQEPDREIKILDGPTARVTSVGELLAAHGNAPDTAITMVKKVEEIQTTTAQELASDTSIDPKQPIRVLRGRQSLDAATVAELMMGSDDSHSDAIYYVRTVKDTDTQGIWGIIQYGLIDNFGRGIAIRRGEDINTYRVDIPRTADEMVNSRNSSFLGRLIFDKSQHSYIYNLEQGRMGRNPDMIRPGQELLIIRFTADELVDIYKHFVNSRRS